MLPLHVLQLSEFRTCNQRRQAEPESPQQAVDDDTHDGDTRSLAISVSFISFLYILFYLFRSVVELYLHFPHVYQHNITDTERFK